MAGVDLPCGSGDGAVNRVRARVRSDRVPDLERVGLPARDDRTSFLRSRSSPPKRNRVNPDLARVSSQDDAGRVSLRGGFGAGDQRGRDGDGTGRGGRSADLGGFDEGGRGRRGEGAVLERRDVRRRGRDAGETERRGGSEGERIKLRAVIGGQFCSVAVRG